MSKNASLTALAENMRPVPSPKNLGVPNTTKIDSANKQKRVSLYLPPELYKRLRWLSVENEQSMNEIVIDAILKRINSVKT